MSGKSKDLIERIYSSLLQTLNVVIQRDFVACGLDKDFKVLLHDLATKAVEENWEGWKIIQSGVSYAVELAYSLKNRYNRSLCYYLKMALKSQWIEHWVLSFRGI